MCIFEVDYDENYLSTCNIFSIFTVKYMKWKQRRAEKDHQLNLKADGKAKMLKSWKNDGHHF